MKDLRATKQSNEKALMKKKGVVGVGVGEKWIDGKPTGKPSILVFVQRKFSARSISSLHVLSAYSSKDLVPDEVDGVQTDVIEVGIIKPQTGFKTKVRPIKPGFSVGHRKITAGTIGGVFLDRDNDIVILSNNHVLACFDEKTEVLTKDGWKKWDTVVVNDEIATLSPTNELEYQKPSKIHKFHYDGKLHHFRSKHIDQLVTPNHRLYCREDYRNNTKKSEWGFTRADQAVTTGNKTIRFSRTAKWHCTTIAETKEKIEIPINDIEAWVEFLGMFLAEGSTTYSPEYYDRHGKRKRGEEYITSIRNLDRKFLDDCKSLLDKLGFHSFINYKSGYCRSYDKDLYNYLKRFGKSHNKFIPTEIKQLKPYFLRILLQSLTRGDGCTCGKTNRNHKFCLSSKKLIDDIQELAIKLGGCATVRRKKGSGYNPNGIYYLCEVFWTNLHPKVRELKFVQYSGMVYCATVPNGILMVRRNGKPCWSGNSENNASVGDLIFQPGPTDTRQEMIFRQWPDPVADLPYIGTLKKFIQIKKNRNTQDSAIAKVHPKLLGLISATYPVVNKQLKGFANAVVGSQVQKCGRTTGYTTGRIMGLDASFSIEYDFGVAKFDDCIVLSNMSKGGDSGSIICDMDMGAVGLLFAGSPRVTIANPMRLVQQTYGLKLWSQPKEFTIGTEGWAKRITSDATMTVDTNHIEIDSPANHYCYYEHAIDDLQTVSCRVNTGTDVGATWAPGLVVQWPNGMLKVNLRAKGTFGGYFNSNNNLSIGKTKANTDYFVRIRKTSNTWQGEVKDGGKWHTVIAVPLSVFPHNPVSVRIGKTGILGHGGNYRVAGERGKCTIRDFKIN